MTLFDSLIVDYTVSRNVVCLSWFGGVCLCFRELIKDDGGGGGRHRGCCAKCKNNIHFRSCISTPCALLPVTRM